MRVGVDGRSLENARGVAHYTAGLLGALASLYPDDEWRLFTPSRGPLAVTPPSRATLVRHPLGGRVLFGAAALTGRPRLDRLLGADLDVLLAPAPAPLALSADVPLVLVVHDLSFEERPHDFTAYERLWHTLARPQRLVARATRIIAVSEATRIALARAWGIDAAHVTVVAPGVERPAAPTRHEIDAVRARHRVPERYLLAVGALEPRKAPELLVGAYQRARAAGLDAGLVLAGEGRLAGRLGGVGVVITGQLAPSDLDTIYAGALALVMPSWLEGFGLPPLEALARGTPAVVSDLPVFTETLGAAALRFRPGDEVGLAAALLQIATDGALRQRLVTAGQVALAPLHWERAAREARRVLAEAAAS